MKRQVLAITALLGLLACGTSAGVRAQDNTFSGTVDRVWEDGFQLNTGDRAVRVDTWDLYNDGTAQHLSVGDAVTIMGEFEGGEFDAISLTNHSTPTSSVQPTMTTTGLSPAEMQARGNSLSGRVERIWEDGFRLNTGDRTYRVDTWAICGDSTAAFVQVGDSVTVYGELDGGEFDIFSMTREDGTALCQ